MKHFTKLLLAALYISTLALTGCFHIIEEASFKSNGSGSYKMTLDLSSVKGMVDMLKSMSEEGKDQGGEKDASDEAPDMGGAPDTDISKMASEMSQVAQSLKGIAGLTNVQEIYDTTTFTFGYAFDFTDVAALNKAMKTINKEKYENDVEEVFRFKNGNFERLDVGDIGAEMKKSMAKSEETEGAPDMEMFKSFFGDMSYKQVYHFPDATVKKSSNPLSQISGDGRTVTIMLKPFDEEMMKDNPKVGTSVKLK
ncbi:MAG: hypothetical protein ABMA02_10460 [Saprospiraceae bacterium]